MVAISQSRLAARACIRHPFTDNEDRLVELDAFDNGFDDFEYRDIKSCAHDAVHDLLAAHRRPDEGAAVRSDSDC